VGRAAIHPRQVAVIAAAFRPSPEEIADARAVVEAFARASDAGSGVLVLDDGRMIDPAMVVQARAVLVRAGDVFPGDGS
jgi:citrate lyase subunit beta/citryl-CoA lyase